MDLKIFTYVKWDELLCELASLFLSLPVCQIDVVCLLIVTFHSFLICCFSFYYHWKKDKFLLQLLLPWDTIRKSYILVGKLCAICFWLGKYHSASVSIFNSVFFFFQWMPLSAHSNGWRKLNGNNPAQMWTQTWSQWQQKWGGGRKLLIDFSKIRDLYPKYVL